MKESMVFLSLLSLVTLMTHAQRKPEFGSLPEPGPDRIEVRFALGERAVTCKYFHLTANVGRQVVIDGKFASGFRIPQEAKTLPRRDALELDLKCGKQHWHFTNVSERVFLRGWWWVGTDYPPFQTEFQGPRFQDAAWIHYLITDPVNDSGFDVYKACPAKLKDQKRGPCYDN